jgi:hypothetical protein
MTIRQILLYVTIRLNVIFFRVIVAIVVAPKLESQMVNFIVTFDPFPNKCATREA